MNAEKADEISAELVPGPKPVPRRWFVAAVAGVAALTGGYLWALKTPSTMGGLKVAGAPMGNVPFSELEARLDAAAKQFLDGNVMLSLGGRKWPARRRDVG